MKIKFINNYSYKGNWNKFFHIQYKKDLLNIIHFLFGTCNLFLFIT